MQVYARLLFAYILFNICTLTSADYYISKNSKLSYLHHKFDQIEEEIFPADIRIKFSVSQLVGTLLYSMDRNMNQLLLIFHDTTPPTLTLEYNKQKTSISISKLCSCEWCRYETLDLRLRIANREFHLRCNGGDTQSLVLGKTKDLKKDYPIMYNATNDSTTSINEAHIWLVNTPPIGESTPNHYQTHGCIFEVAYKRRPISFKDVTTNIKRSCKRTCIDNICNGGQCLETYNDYPVCNCTTTFMNGRYCNDSIEPKNLKTKSSLYVFDMIKISWRSSGQQIMGLYNTDYQTLNWKNQKARNLSKFMENSCEKVERLVELQMNYLSKLNKTVRELENKRQNKDLLRGMITEQVEKELSYIRLSDGQQILHRRPGDSVSTKEWIDVLLRKCVPLIPFIDDMVFSLYII